MADPFNLTSRPIRVTAATKQALTESLDVSAYDEVDVVCVLDEFAGSAANIAIRVITGMQRETEVGWVELVPFTPGSFTGLGTADIKNANSKMLKYIRWEVTSLGSATAITFDISGMLRRRR